MREKITTDRPAHITQTLAHETTAAVSSTGEYYPPCPCRIAKKLSGFSQKS
jgi:hypothetical protein